MASVEGPRGLQQNKLTSLVSTPRFDFRDSSKWVFRYHKDSRQHWDKRANQLVQAVMTDTDNALQDFTYASPKSKHELIELASFFGTDIEPLKIATSSKLMAEAMLQYSNPDDISVREQFEFFSEGTLYTKPEMFFSGLNHYFYVQRQKENLAQMMDITLRRRTETFPDKDPNCESTFIRRNVNRMIAGTTQNGQKEFARNYSQNKDMYDLFGLRYDETESKLVRIVPPSEEAKMP